MEILNLKTTYLTQAEIKEYEAAISRISQLEEEKETAQKEIDLLRDRVDSMNIEMNNRHVYFMLNRNHEPTP